MVGCLLFAFTLSPFRNLDIHSPHPQHSKTTLEKSTLQKFDPDGELIWEITSKKITTDEASTKTEGYSVKVSFKKEEMDNLTIFAQKLTLFNKTSDLLMEGDVSVSGDDLKLTTQRLRWSEKQKTLETKTGVRIKYGNLKLTGDVFNYSPDKNVLAIKGNAHLGVDASEESQS